MWGLDTTNLASRHKYPGFTRYEKENGGFPEAYEGTE